jgi:ATP-dependent Clp protease ATP-binding subunit ClpA
LGGRFSEAARTAIHEATEEARKRGHGSVEPEHLLLRLLGREAVGAAKALAELGHDPAAIAASLDSDLPHNGTLADGAEMALSDRFKHLIDLTFDEIVRARSKTIGIEHLSIALFGLRGSDAVVQLEQLGIDPESVRRILTAQKS